MPKFITRVPRFIDGQYIHATPDHPVELELPEGTKPDAHLIPVESPAAHEKPKPHYAPKEGPHAQTAAAVHSTPTAQQGKGKGRANDSSPI